MMILNQIEIQQQTARMMINPAQADEQSNKASRKKADTVGKARKKAAPSTSYHLDPLADHAPKQRGPGFNEWEAKQHYGFYIAVAAFAAIFEAESSGMNTTITAMSEIQKSVTVSSQKIYSISKQLYAVQQKAKAAEKREKAMGWVDDVFDFVLAALMGTLLGGPAGFLIALSITGLNMGLSKIKVDGKTAYGAIADGIANDLHLKGKSRDLAEGITKIALSLAVGMAAGAGASAGIGAVDDLADGLASSLKSGLRRFGSWVSEGSSSFFTSSARSAQSLFTDLSGQFSRTFSSIEEVEDVEMGEVEDDNISGENINGNNNSVNNENNAAVNQDEEIREVGRVEERIVRDNEINSENNDGVGSQRLTKKSKGIRAFLMGLNAGMQTLESFRSKNGKSSYNAIGDIALACGASAQNAQTIGTWTMMGLTIAATIASAGAGSQAALVGEATTSKVMSRIFQLGALADSAAQIYGGHNDVILGQLTLKQTNIQHEMMEQVKKSSEQELMQAPLNQLIKNYVQVNANAMKAAIELLNSASKSLDPLIQA